MHAVLPPPWLLHLAVAAVWLYEGLWCKLLSGEPHQVQVVEAVPRYGPRSGAVFLKLLGMTEVGIAVWAWSDFAPLVCALVQTVLLIALNAAGVFWARHIIHDPAGMIVKNFAFLVLGWVAASFPAWT